MNSKLQTSTLTPAGFVARLRRLFFERRGPLTQQLVRSPAGFGIGQVPTGLQPDATTTTVCGFCSTGCGLKAHLRKGEAINLSPADGYPVNLGMACPKGWEALTPLRAKDRATRPLLRRQRGKRPEAVDWSTALDVFVRRTKGIQREHGTEAVAWLGTGQMPTEELALLGALAKFGMGIVHGDGNTRQCMATAVTAYKQAFGFDAPPYTYQDFEESDVLVFVGANPCIAHPIMWERVCRNPHDPEIIVVDPRVTETAMAATQHLQLAPKQDLTLLYGLARRLIELGAVDERFVREHTSGFDDFRRFVRDFEADRVSREAGVSCGDFERAARAIAQGKRVSFWWTMGVNQSHEGVRVAQAIVNLALMTGNIGRPGTGANSITGQCNAMGSRLFSNTSSLFAGRDFENPHHRARVADILGLDEACIPKQNGLCYDQIIEKIVSGEIRALWVVATNPAHSWINQRDLRDALRKLDFLVVQDMYDNTETARLADLVLPAAGWGEKEGTFINSERRIGRIRKVARAPGEALADFYIFKLIAEEWGVGSRFERWTDPEGTFRILRELSRGTPCDISGIESYDQLSELGGVQWPLPENQPIEVGSQRRLFEDGRFFHQDQKARFRFDEPRPAPEPSDARYPLVLLTGRGSSSQWHTQTRTAKSAQLRTLSPQDPYAELNPSDARRLGIEDGDQIIVESRRGTVEVRAWVSPNVAPGQVFVPMHDAQTNRLTFPAFDPHSRQPAYKACAVRVGQAQRA